MKVDLDARTLEAMRVICDHTTHGYPVRADAVAAIRAFLAAHDSARDAERDEALANALYAAAGGCLPKQCFTIPQRDAWKQIARAARDFIAKEQGQ